MARGCAPLDGEGVRVDGVNSLTVLNFVWYLVSTGALDNNRNVHIGHKVA